MFIRKRLSQSAARVPITVVSDQAARLALNATALDGDLVYQRDTDELYAFEASGPSWNRIGGKQLGFVFADTAGMDFTYTAATQTVTVEPIYSPDAPQTGYRKAVLTTKANGIHAEIPDSEIQDAALINTILDTNSVDLTYNDTTNKLSADVRVSTNAADAGKILALIDIQSTGVVGLRAQVTLSDVDHGSISGLGDDDHSQYALLAGRATGQTLRGGTAASENLNLYSTSHATKGRINLGANSSAVVDEVNKFFGIGGVPSVELDVIGAVAMKSVLNYGLGTEVTDYNTANASFVRISSALGVSSLAGVSPGKLLILFNDTGANLTIRNQAAVGTAVNRIITGTGADVDLAAGASLLLYYETTFNTRWLVVGGSGGGGAMKVGTVQAVAAAGSLTLQTAQRQLVKAMSTGGPVTLSSTTPLPNGTVDGQEVKIVGQSDIDSITMLSSGNMVLNGSVTLGINECLDLFWDATAAKWIESSRSD